MSFHQADWLSTLFQLLGNALAVKQQGGSEQDVQNATIAAGVAIAAHVLAPAQTAPAAPAAPVAATPAVAVARPT